MQTSPTVQSTVHDLIAPVATTIADMVVGDRHSVGHYGADNKQNLRGFGN
jgi:hypothetical protein